jgi:hypothetical protein
MANLSKIPTKNGHLSEKLDKSEMDKIRPEDTESHKESPT